MWFAEKFVSLLIEQHRLSHHQAARKSCDLLKNSYLCLLNNTSILTNERNGQGCDLLKNSYLCLLNNTRFYHYLIVYVVVICWKIRIFAYWPTPRRISRDNVGGLWFAEKFVSLLIEQHHLERFNIRVVVVICWKIRIFAYWTTPSNFDLSVAVMLWFAEKFVSLLIEQHRSGHLDAQALVVICWKIRIFAYWTTPLAHGVVTQVQLWFAEKFVSLLIEQHLTATQLSKLVRCDLLKNSYLCLLNNTLFEGQGLEVELWFAEKFVSLLIEQHLL